MNDRLHSYELLARQVPELICTYIPETQKRKFHIHSVAIIWFEPQMPPVESR